MKLKLHHINLSTNNVAGMDQFYRDVLGLKTETEGLPFWKRKRAMMVMLPLFQTAISKRIWRKRICKSDFAPAISSTRLNAVTLPIAPMI